MRHILAVIVSILILAVPWLMYHPDQARYLFSRIQIVEDQLTAAVISHIPKSVLEIKSRYASQEKRGIFATAGYEKKVKILLVPGHEPDYGGAEYGMLKERDLVVELAQNLENFLIQNERYQVFVSRDKNAWKPTFADYFKNGWDEIIAWEKLHKEEVAKLTHLGEFHPVRPIVEHNKARSDVAFRLFGIGKWANENDMDIIIHIHFNDYPGHGNVSGRYSGFAIYVPEKEYFNSTTTKALADTVFKRLSKYNPVSDFSGESKGIVEDQDLIAVGAHNSVNAASMLIEYGYIYENQFNDPTLRNSAIRDLAFQTYLGLQDFFDDHNAASINGSFDTLVMPHYWQNRSSDERQNNPDIFALQTALLMEGEYPPPGKTLNDCPRTGRLGNCTKAALEAFQKKKGIKGEAGVIGKRTREELNKLYAVKTI